MFLFAVCFVALNQAKTTITLTDTNRNAYVVKLLLWEQCSSQHVLSSSLPVSSNKSKKYKKPQLLLLQWAQVGEARVDL